MTYNIRHGQGIDFKYSLERIAEVIKKFDPDIISINEIYEFPGFLNQPKKLAEQLAMDYRFQPNVWYGPFGYYGNAVFTKHKIANFKDLKLPRVYGFEQRGLLLLSIKLGTQTINFGSTHLSLGHWNRKAQVDYLVSVAKDYKNFILCGDMNAHDHELVPLLGPLQLSGGHKTYPSNNPRKQLDFIYYGIGFKIKKSRTTRSMASDHLPIIVDFEIPSIE